MTDTDTKTPAEWLARAAEVAVHNIDNGGGPFGAVIVNANGVCIAEGANRVVATPDPTAHAEVVAIRMACAALGTHELLGHVLYTSCEPCPLCRAAAHWARLDAVVFDATRNDAAAAGFDDAMLYALLANPDAGSAQTPVRQGEASGGQKALQAWTARTDVTPY